MLGKVYPRGANSTGVNVLLIECQQYVMAQCGFPESGTWATRERWAGCVDTAVTSGSLPHRVLLLSAREGKRILLYSRQL